VARKRKQTRGDEIDYERLAQLAPSLREVGARRAQADTELRAATAELEPLILEAHEAGLPVAQIARESSMSRQGIYNLLRRRGKL
jgi:hypothetical protein